MNWSGERRGLPGHGRKGRKAGEHTTNR